MSFPRLLLGLTLVICTWHSTFAQSQETQPTQPDFSYYSFMWCSPACLVVELSISAGLGETRLMHLQAKQ